MGDINFGITTELDKYMKMCVEIKTRCMLNRRSGACDPSSCNRNCATYRSLDTYMAGLAPIESSYVDAMVANRIRYIEACDRGYMRKRGLSVFRTALKLIGVALFVFMLAALVPFGMWFLRTRDAPPQVVTSKFGQYVIEDNDVLDARVREVIKDVHAKIYDMNGDGLINCQDYSVLFHYLWNRKYKALCMMTINRNPKTGMNHMFITIYLGCNVYHIEPQYPEWFYIMETVWGDKYDSRYDENCDTKKVYSKVTIRRGL